MSEDKTQQNADALLAAMATIGDWAEEIDGSVMACAKALARIATALEGIQRGLERVEREVDQEIGKADING
jgi:hypothetical protein